jgi:hypothetical protein
MGARSPHRWLRLAVLVAVAVGIPGCGGSGGPGGSGGGSAAQPPSLFPLDGSAAPLFAPLSGSPGAWVIACSVLTEADVAAATSGYGTKIVVTGHQAKEEQNEPDDRISTCDFPLVGVEDVDGMHNTISGLGLTLVIDEIGALVRIGDRLYKFSGRAPYGSNVSNAQGAQWDREILVKLAKVVMAKVGGTG